MTIISSFAKAMAKPSSVTNLSMGRELRQYAYMISGIVCLGGAAGNSDTNINASMDSFYALAFTGLLLLVKGAGTIFINPKKPS